jgi:hypothetical protein
VAYRPEKKGRMIVVGDLHSDLVSFERLLAQLNYDARWNNDPRNPSPYYFVFVGDYIDIGRNGLALLERVLGLFVGDPEHVTLLAGNHDTEFKTEKSAEYIRHHHAYNFFFKQMKNAAGEKGERFIREWYDFALKLPVMMTTANKTVILHAAPPTPIDTNWNPSRGLEGVAEHPYKNDVLTWSFVKTDGSQDEDHPNHPDHKPYMSDGLNT